MTEVEETKRRVEAKTDKAADADDDDDDERDDDDEEDEEDEESEEEEQQQEAERRRPKKKRRRRKAQGFIIEEADVDEDDEEENEDAEEGYEEFIKEHKAREKYAAEEGGINARDVENRRRLQQMFNDEDEEAIESYYRNKYATEFRGQYAENRSTQEISQQALKPTINDPSLWMVKCRQGEEKVTCMQLMRKFIAMSGTDHPLLIKSVIAPEGIKGKLYIEAVRQGHVTQAIEGLSNLRISQWSIKMVPRNEMEAVLNVVQTTPAIRKNQWVRLKRGLYRDDLAQVVEVDNSQNRVTLRLIPRIDFQRLIDKRNGMTDDTQKRKRNMFKPAQCLFSHEKAQECGFEVTKEYQFYQFAGERYDKSGFLVKAFPTNSIIVEGVKPQINELEKFEQTPEGVDIRRVVGDIADSSNIRAEERFQPGDTVVVKAGHSLQHMRGTVTHISDDEKVIVKSHQEDLKDKPISFEAQWLRKSFSPGDHVRVLRGRYERETGLVVSVTDKNEVVVCSDLSMHEMTIFPDDLQKCTEKATGVDRLGHFTYGDLVQLDPTTVGVIVRMERDLIHALNVFGRVVAVKPQSITKKPEQKFAMALDADGYKIKARDSVTVLDSSQPNVKVATVRHVFRQFVFLHSKLCVENGGTFVCRARSVRSSGSAAAGHNAGGAGSLNEMMVQNNMMSSSGTGSAGSGGGGGGASTMPWQSPASTLHSPQMPFQSPRTYGGGGGGGHNNFYSQNNYGSGGGGGGGGGSSNAPVRVDDRSKHLLEHADRITRDEKILGMAVRVAVGQYKGQRGIVKDATVDVVRIELHDKCRTITVERDRVLKQSQTVSAGGPMQPGQFSSFAPSAGAYGGGSKTPSYSYGSRTPGPNLTEYGGGGGGGRTPAASRTPGYDAGSRTPRFDAAGGDAYDGGRTPRYGEMVNPLTGGRSSRVAGGGGGQTPGYDASKSPAYGLGGDWNDSMNDDAVHHRGGDAASAAAGRDIDAVAPKSVAPMMMDLPTYPKTPAASSSSFANMPPPESPAMPPLTPRVPGMGNMLSDPESPYPAGSVLPPMTPHVGVGSVGLGGGRVGGMPNPSPAGYTLAETPSGVNQSPFGGGGSSITGGATFTPSGDVTMAGTSGLDAAAANGDWVSEGLEVMINNYHEDRSLNGKRAEVRSVTGSTCALYVPAKDKVVTVLNHHVAPVLPTASHQKVQIIAGDDREHTALVISYDPPDCVLKIEGHDNVSMLPLKFLCKYFNG